MAEWLVVKTNSRNPPHQIGYGREKQRKNSIGSTTQKQGKGFTLTSGNKFLKTIVNFLVGFLLYVGLEIGKQVKWQ